MRLKIIPLIKEIFPEADKAVSRLTELAEEDDLYIENQAKKIINFAEGRAEISIPADKPVFGRAAVMAMKSLGMEKDWEKIHTDDAYNLSFNNTGKIINLPCGITAVKEYDNVYVEHYNFPLDKVCNPEVVAQVHNGACMRSKIALAAKQQGHYWDMASRLYDMKTLKTESILETAKELNLDEKKLWYDIVSKETEKELLAEIAYCQKIGVAATPAMYINGKPLIGLRRYEDIEKLIIENGGQKRS